MQVEMKQRDELGIILFILLFVSLLPVIISTTIIDDLYLRSIYDVIIGGFFIIQVIVMFFYFYLKTDRILNREMFLFAWLIFSSQALTIYFTLISGFQINNYDLLNIFVRFISVLIWVVFPSYLAITQKGLRGYMLLMVVLGSIASIYNLIINFEGITNIFNINNPYAVNYKSFFINRNGFAQLLFFSIIANTYLYFTRKSFLYLLSFLLFGLNLITSLSRGALLATLIFLLIFFFSYFKQNYLVKVTIILTGLIAALVLLVNENLLDFILKAVIRENMGTTSRIDLWQIGLEVFKESNWLFGVGYFTSIDFILQSGRFVTEFHSFYIDTLVGGGLVDLFLHLAVLVYILIKIKHILKFDRLAGFLYFSSYIALFVYALFESISFFSMGYVSTIFTIFFITIPLLYHNSLE